MLLAQLLLSMSLRPALAQDAPASDASSQVLPQREVDDMITNQMPKMEQIQKGALARLRATGNAPGK